MNRKSVFAFFAAAMLAAQPALAAVVSLDFGKYSIDYDDSSDFGSGFFDRSSGSTISFGWSVPTSVGITGSVNPPTLVDFSMPLFEVRAAPGYSFSGTVTGFVGNLVYAEFGNNPMTRAGVIGTVAFDHGSDVQFQRELVKTPTSANFGYLSGSASVTRGSFETLTFAGVLELFARGNSSGIAAQPQNEFTLSFAVAAVPEPDSVAMLLAGLGLVGAVALRRRRLPA